MILAIGRRRLLVAVAPLLAAMGCFSLQPVAGQPLPLGSTVSMSINDAGRASLGGQMGPEISDIEGRLLQHDSAEYVLSVSQVSLIRGGTQTWAGERIRIKSDFVTGIAEKKFSRGRSVALGVAAIGLVAIGIKQGILGNIAGEEGKTPPDTGRTIRYPRFIR